MDFILILKIIIAIILAITPIIIWGYLFYIKDPEPRRLILITFIGGMLSVIPIMFYKWTWQYIPKINIFFYLNNFDHHLIQIGDLLTIPISVIFSFMFVGVIEEYMKHAVVKYGDKKYFRNIDDSIEFSIIAALGFAFIENILYFLMIWEHQGVENLVIAFIFRSIFSTFAHILFSGIFGYYYGIANFATPIYQEEILKNRHKIINFLHKCIHLKGETIFKEEKITEGLIISMSLHAVFNIILELDFTILILPFLIIGYLFLSYLFDKKEDHKEYGRISS
ncbi:hypothetical protein A2335_03065 [Candidatus Peregrinibacteria bacterium RIFOXYB2_FULL_32_7]|nr:MAG: hypothetical protein A2335_03065 [Candidatus Peregrinibacteria bacterium RIFOXYB2_FULL_32_7]